MTDVARRYYWKCQPQKGGECPHPGGSTLPANPLPGGEAKGMPWFRIGLHKNHEANFWLRERLPEPDIGIPLDRFLREIDHD
jgi:hypothetical protein